MINSEKYANIVGREKINWQDKSHTCIGYIDDVSHVVSGKNIVQLYIQDLFELFINIHNSNILKINSDKTSLIHY